MEGCRGAVVYGFWDREASTAQRVLSACHDLGLVPSVFILSSSVTDADPPPRVTGKSCAARL